MARVRPAVADARRLPKGEPVRNPASERRLTLGPTGSGGAPAPAWGALVPPPAPPPRAGATGRSPALAAARRRWTGPILLLLPFGTLAQVVASPASTRLDVGDLLCCGACAALAWRAVLAREALPRRILPVLTAAALFWFAADARLCYLALTVAGLALLAARPGPAAGRSAWLWLALAGHGLWGLAVLKFAAPLLMPAETHLVGLAARLTGAAAAVQGTRVDGPGGWFIFVLEGCSSLHGLSLDLLVWASALALAEARVTRRGLALLAAAAGATVLANTLRILAMARSPQAYHVWHDGWGAVVFGLALALLAIVPAVLACRPGRARAP